jgi:glycosyltransferase involved in cell wall biosynthesis
LLSNRNLEPHYNVECTLRAFALVQARVPDARLVVAGDGSQRRYLREVAERLALRNVDLIGAVTPDRMIGLYDEAEIFVNASNIDNQPLSIIEAFAAGLPVVTTNPGGIPYMVVNEATGLMVECNDHEALARSILRLLESPELVEKLTARARAECEKYRWAAVRDRWLRLYRELTNRALRESEFDSIAARKDDALGPNTV